MKRSFALGNGKEAKQCLIVAFRKQAVDGKFDAHVFSEEQQIVRIVTLAIVSVSYRVPLCIS